MQEPCKRLNKSRSKPLMHLHQHFLTVFYLQHSPSQIHLKMSRKVNFTNDTPLKVIPEDGENTVFDDDDDVDSLANVSPDFRRSHSIHEVVSAKAASRIFRLRSLEARKNKQRDEGLAEVICFYFCMHFNPFCKSTHRKQYEVEILLCQFCFFYNRQRASVA